MVLPERVDDPYYGEIGRGDYPFVNREAIPRLQEAKERITKDTIKMLLGDFNWRSRSVGAFFAALTKQYDLFPVIGNMLLQSEVCIAGDMYTVVLATHSAELSMPVYVAYLRYYLTQPQYVFQQGSVYAALLSQARGNRDYADIMAEIADLWSEYVSASPVHDHYKSVDLQETARQFDSEVAVLVRLRDSPDWSWIN